jgi:hypothetical protein
MIAHCCLISAPHVLGVTLSLLSQGPHAVLRAALPVPPHALPRSPICRASTAVLSLLVRHIIRTQGKPDMDLGSYYALALIRRSLLLSVPALE